MTDRSDAKSSISLLNARKIAWQCGNDGVNARMKTGGL
jgi:hypothetical protein